MATLSELVTFDINRLFNGAIDVDWLSSDADKAIKAAKAFVFHGPNYHGVSQKDVGATGHKLIDSASFVNKVLQNVEKPSGNPFVLAIAGFGSGKSHLAITLSELLTTTDAEIQHTILQHLIEVDQNIALDIKGHILSLGGQTLVLTLNGMNNYDLTSELLAKTKAVLQAKHIDTQPLDNLRKRFKHAADILPNLDDSLLHSLFESTHTTTKDAVIEQLLSFDEFTYAKTSEFLSSIGIPLNVIGDETAKDVLRGVVDNYIGDGKSFDRMLILFDEFGHYMEYATSHPQIAGDGALQHLFEGIQANDGKISFVGFVQYELKVYEQRLSSSEYKNEIRRFITRFDVADKLFLSSNLETLVASLLVKSVEPKLPETYSTTSFEQIKHWYPITENYSAWHIEGMFSQVIVHGCWPLSPLAMWTLFHLSSSGQYLQQRSALALLKAALNANANVTFSAEHPALPAVGLWTADLQREFEEVEEQTARGSIMQAFNAVLEKSSQHLSSTELTILRSIVLLSQTRLRAESLDDAKDALLAFSGLSQGVFEKGLSNLVDELNVVAWDEAFKQFEILGDTVSRPKFMQMLQRKSANEYDEERRSKLFIKGAENQASLQAIDCDFANENKILTQEWRFTPRYTFWLLFKKTVANIVTELITSNKYNPVDAPRGIVVYCYVPSSEDEASVLEEAQRILKAQSGNPAILLILLFDNGTIAKSLVELDILSSLTAEEKEKFSRLIATHERKQTELLSDAIKNALLKRNFLSAYPSSVTIGRLTTMGNALFSKIYSKAIPFPFDGYASSRGNAARDCAEFTRKMLTSQFTYDDIKTMPIQQKNRATNVLKESWNAFSRDGSVTLKQPEASVRKLVLDWDRMLAEENGLNCTEALKVACTAPYGANIASAGLLLATFIQARLSSITVLHGANQASFQNEINNIFSGIVLDPAYLEDWTLCKSEGGDSEWDQLLADWGNCATYRELTMLNGMKEDLEKRLPIPMTIRVRVDQMKQDSLKAKCLIEDVEREEDDARSKIDNGIQQEKVSVLTWGASLMYSLAKKMVKDPRWNPDSDIRPLRESVNVAKQHIIKRFDAWYPTNRPKGNNADALSTFKHDMLAHVCSNLKNLELSEQRERLEKHVERIAKAFEYVADASRKMTSADNWIAVNSTVPGDATVAQLSALSGQIAQQEELLKDARTSMKRCGQETLVEDLTARIDKLEELLRTIKQTLKANDRRAKDIWNLKLSVDTVSSIIDKVRELERLYSGSGTNVDDFRIMRNVATSFSDSYRQFDTLQIPDSEYANLTASAQNAFVERFSDDEPPWPLDESFEAMLAVCKKKRYEASSAWFEDARERVDNLESLSLQEADSLYQYLSTPPVYFDESAFATKLVRLRKQVEKYLESKGVEWLYEKYTQLAPTAQKSFIKLISTKKNN